MHYTFSFIILEEQGLKTVGHIVNSVLWPYYETCEVGLRLYVVSVCCILITPVSQSLLNMGLCLAVNQRWYI